ncbi:hypothetical protein DKP78_13715, partial [Enterococcus faecium]
MRQAYVTGRINQVAAGSEPDPGGQGSPPGPAGTGPSGEETGPTRELAARWVGNHTHACGPWEDQENCASRRPGGSGQRGRGDPALARPPAAACIGRLGQTGRLCLATRGFGTGGRGSVEPQAPPAWRRTRWGGEDGPVVTGDLPWRVSSYR